MCESVKYAESKRVSKRGGAGGGRREAAGAAAGGKWGGRNILGPARCC